jgi:hypothetical protein
MKNAKGRPTQKSEPALRAAKSRPAKQRFRETDPLFKAKDSAEFLMSPQVKNIKMPGKSKSSPEIQHRAHSSHQMKSKSVDKLRPESKKIKRQHKESANTENIHPGNLSAKKSRKASFQKAIHLVTSSQSRQPKESKPIPKTSGSKFYQKTTTNSNANPNLHLFNLPLKRSVEGNGIFIQPGLAPLLSETAHVGVNQGTLPKKADNQLISLKKVGSEKTLAHKVLSSKSRQPKVDMVNSNDIEHFQRDSTKQHSSKHRNSDLQNQNVVNNAQIAGHGETKKKKLTKKKQRDYHLADNETEFENIIHKARVDFFTSHAVKRVRSTSPNGTRKSLPDDSDHGAVVCNSKSKKHQLQLDPCQKSNILRRNKSEKYMDSDLSNHNFFPKKDDGLPLKSGKDAGRKAEKNTTNKINIGTIIVNRPSEKNSIQVSHPRCTSAAPSDLNFALAQYMKWQKMEKMVDSLRKKFQNSLKDPAMFESIMKVLHCAQASRKEVKRTLDHNIIDRSIASHSNDTLKTHNLRESFNPNANDNPEITQDIGASSLLKSNSFFFQNFEGGHVSPVNRFLKQKAPEINHIDIGDSKQLLKSAKGRVLNINSPRNYFYWKHQNSPKLPLLVSEILQMPKRDNEQFSQRNSSPEDIKPDDSDSVNYTLEMDINKFADDSFLLKNVYNEVDFKPKILDFKEISDKKIPIDIERSLQNLNNLHVLFKAPSPKKTQSSPPEKDSPSNQVFVQTDSVLKEVISEASREFLAESQTNKKSSKMSLEKWVAPSKNLEMISQELDGAVGTGRLNPHHQLPRIKSLAKSGVKLSYVPRSDSKLNAVTDSLTLVDRSCKKYFGELYPQYSVCVENSVENHALGLHDKTNPQLPSHLHRSQQKICEDDIFIDRLQSLNILEHTPQSSQVKKVFRPNINILPPVQNNQLSVPFAKNLSKSISARNPEDNTDNPVSLYFQQLFVGQKSVCEITNTEPIRNTKPNLSSGMMGHCMAQSDLVSHMPKAVVDEKLSSAKKSSCDFILKEQGLDKMAQSTNSDQIRISKDDCSLMEAPFASTNSPCVEFIVSDKNAVSLKKDDFDMKKSSHDLVDEIESIVVDFLVIDLLDDEDFSIMAAQFINDRLAGLNELIELKNFDLPPVHSQFINDPIFIDNFYSRHQIAQTQREQTLNKQEDIWEKEIEAQVAQILNDSIHTVYAIRTHFKAVREFAKLILHHYEFIDFGPLIDLLNTGQKLKAGEYFNQIMSESFDARKQLALFSGQLLNHLPMEKEFAVIESRIMVSLLDKLPAHATLQRNRKNPDHLPQSHLRRNDRGNRQHPKPGHSHRNVQSGQLRPEDHLVGRVLQATPIAPRGSPRVRP